MKRIGVREFRDHATRYLSGQEILAIERHGRPIGFYIPTDAGREERAAEALTSLEKKVKEVLAETGLSEEELSRLYDLDEPLATSEHRHEERTTNLFSPLHVQAAEDS